ncbi:hypothetical protein IJH23_00250 [Candidatus Saccharibacteria bacterium]|nr:hypothetical protein [Candidatus Saccharibacteria bacterium]
MASRAERKGTMPGKITKANTTVNTKDAKPERKAPEFSLSDFERLLEALRHCKELDDHERRIAALEGKVPKDSSEAEKEAEEEAAAEAEKAGAQKPQAKKAEAPKPQAEKANTEPSKVVFPDAPKGAVRWGKEWLYITTDTEESYPDSDPSILVAKAKGIVLGLVFCWYDRNGNPLDLLTPAQVRKYVPRNRMTKAARINQ